ncbi:DUF1499 domain-containing protein [Nitrosospira briensis]|uniref:DUF1499 domain-containing protein n=1 Tax=Nitrosospira briensis TaxID=35799 RepID=UPI0008F1012F|nr:DUF1499 domain-containing protein [Nitrosospira briensis]SFN99584.1 Uncharacterized conserved protein, DUF1499 family [Nitrosospira briensis]
MRNKWAGLAVDHHDYAATAHDHASRQPPSHCLSRGIEMAIMKWALIVVALVVITGLLAGQLGLLKGTPPADLGVHDGKLKAPSKTPNSVSSQAQLYPDHPQRTYADIAPLPLKGDAAATMDRIASIIEGMSGVEIVKREPDYLYVQFTTRLMKYVDDAEFWFDPDSEVIQVRSASRLGKSDLGVNRERIEFIRQKLDSA